MWILLRSVLCIERSWRLFKVKSSEERPICWSGPSELGIATTFDLHPVQDTTTVMVLLGAVRCIPALSSSAVRPNWKGSRCRNCRSGCNYCFGCIPQPTQCLVQLVPSLLIKFWGRFLRDKLSEEVLLVCSVTLSVSLLVFTLRW